MDIGRLVEWIKLSPRHLLPLSLFPASFYSRRRSGWPYFGIVGFVSEWRPYFGLGFLLSITLLGSTSMDAVFP